jgi:hypothetical protein
MTKIKILMKPNAGKNMIQWGKEVFVLGRENGTDILDDIIPVSKI